MIRRFMAARPVLAAFVFLAAVLPRPALAQATASLEAGVTRVRYGGDPALSLFAISPFVQFEQPDGWLAAMATVSAFEGGGWGLQTTLAGSRYLPQAFGMRPEIAGNLQGSRGDDASRAGEAGGRLRMHWLGADHGVWGGAGVGLADGLTGTRSVRSVEFGGWLRQEALTVVLTLEPSWVGNSIRTTDTQGLVRWVSGPLEVAGFGGVRHQRSPEYDAARWGGVSGAWWFGSRIAATLGIGSYPADLARDFGAGRYATVSVRIASRRPDPAERADQPTYRLLPPLARPVVEGFRVEPGSGSSRRIVVRAPGAPGVDIMGDFTDWQPVPLSAAPGGTWIVELPLAPGVHRVNVRLSRGEWGVPPGVPVVKDDFNGFVGLLTIQ